MGGSERRSFGGDGLLRLEFNGLLVELVLRELLQFLDVARLSQIFLKHLVRRKVYNDRGKDSKLSLINIICKIFI